jgi:diguanylate cyclase (GGDEF)-like protein
VYKYNFKIKFMLYSCIAFLTVLYGIYFLTYHWVLEETKQDAAINAKSFVQLIEHEWEYGVIDDIESTAAIISDLPVIREYFDSSYAERKSIKVNINKVLRSIYAGKQYSVSIYSRDGKGMAGIKDGFIKRSDMDNLSDSQTVAGEIYTYLVLHPNVTTISKYDTTSQKLITIKSIFNYQYNIEEGFIVIESNVSEFWDNLSKIKFNDINIMWGFDAKFNLIMSPFNAKYSAIFHLDEFDEMVVNNKTVSVFDDTGFYSLTPLKSKYIDENIFYVGISIPEHYMADSQSNIKEHFVFLAIIASVIILTLIVLFWSRIGRLAREHEDVINLTVLDNLTAVYNRAHFETLVNKQLKQHQSAMIFMIDIGGLKKVNDLYGYKIGDRFLIKIADDIKEIVENKGMVGRFSGAEFHVAVFDCDFNAIIDLLKNINAQKINITDKKLKPKIELGSSLYPEYADNCANLLSYADVALSCVKKTDDCYMAYTKDLGSKYSEEINIEFSVSQAIDNNEFFFHCQPQVNVNDNNIVGYEFLLRWDSAKHGFVSPGVFIPIIEDKGYAERINIYVVDLALKTIKELESVWDTERIIKFSINLSPAIMNFDDHLITIHNKIKKAKIDNEKFSIELEITESGLVVESSDFKHNVLHSMHQLKDDNIGISLDDFGVDYSSLNRLIEYPFDTVKIDRCFVQKLEGEDEFATRAAINAIMTLHRDIGFNIIVEGVETEYQLNVLKSLGVHVIQGYYFYKPLPMDEIRGQLARGADVES